MLRFSSISTLLLCLGLAACTSPLLEPDPKKDKELEALFTAYKKQSEQAALERQKRLERGIRSLIVTKATPAEAARVSVELEGASIPVVVRRLLDEAGIAYILKDVDLRGSVSARFDKLPLTRALNLLLERQGLIAILQEGVMVIREAQPTAVPSSAAPPAFAAPSAPPPTAPPAQPAIPGPAQPLPPGPAGFPPQFPAAPQPPGPPGAPPGFPAPSGPPGAYPGFPGASQSSASSVSRAIQLEQIDTDTASKFLTSLYLATSPGSSASVKFGVQPYINTIILYGPADQVAQAARLLHQIDQDPSHVVIEALVVEFDSDAAEKLGADLQNFARNRLSSVTSNIGSLTQRSLTFTYTVGANQARQYTALIDLLVDQDKARVVSHPYLATLSGKPASINITRDRYVIVQTPSQGATVSTPQAISTGVLLNITPTVTHEKGIRVDLSVEESQFLPTTANIAVEVDKNKAQSTVRVESGETIIIGGLVLNRESRSSAGIPWLRHIPLLNLFFAKYEADSKKQEVAIFVTPHVWQPGMTAPLVEPESFRIKPEDRLSPIERPQP